MFRNRADDRLDTGSQCRDTDDASPNPCAKRQEPAPSLFVRCGARGESGRTGLDPSNTAKRVGCSLLLIIAQTGEAWSKRY